MGGVYEQGPVSGCTPNSYRAEELPGIRRQPGGHARSVWPAYIGPPKDSFHPQTTAMAFTDVSSCFIGTDG